MEGGGSSCEAQKCKVAIRMTQGGGGGGGGANSPTSPLSNTESSPQNR